MRIAEPCPRKRSRLINGCYVLQHISATLGANSGFDQPSMIEWHRAESLSWGARLWKVCHPGDVRFCQGVRHYFPQALVMRRAVSDSYPPAVVPFFRKPFGAKSKLTGTKRCHH